MLDGIYIKDKNKNKQTNKHKNKQNVIALCTRNNISDTCNFGSFSLDNYVCRESFPITARMRNTGIRKQNCMYT